MNRAAPDAYSRIGCAAPRPHFTIAEVIADCEEMGLIGELRAALGVSPGDDDGPAARVVRDLVYELAGAPNRDLAVDVLIHATGVAEFDCRTLREYARKHGMTAEGFRKQVRAMRWRLGLTQPAETWCADAA